MPPVIRRNLARINAGRLYGINETEYLCNLWPTVNMKKELAARICLGHRRDRFASTHRPDNIKRRSNRAICIGGPSNQAEQLTRRIAFDALPAVQYPTGDRLAELQPVFAFALAPHQRNMRQLRIVSLGLVSLGPASLAPVSLDRIGGRSLAASR